MSVFLTVNTPIPTKTNFVWWICEFPQNNIDEVFAQIDAAGAVRCDKIEGRLDGRLYTIDRKQPIILGVGGFLSIVPCTLPLIDMTDGGREIMPQNWRQERAAA